MSNREILTNRLRDNDGQPIGWTDKTGRIIATRDTELLDAVKSGRSITTVSRLTYWDLRLYDKDGETILEEESVNTLAEADDEAWWWSDRIAVE